MIPAMSQDKSWREKGEIFDSLKTSLFADLKNLINDGGSLNFDQLYYNLQTWRPYCESEQDLYSWNIMQSLIWSAERIYAGLDHDYCEMLNAPEFIKQNVGWTKSCIKLLKGDTPTNRCCQVPVILYGTESGIGRALNLVLEILENGDGDIFQYPADMLVTFPTESFTESMHNAWLAVGELLENRDIISKFNGQWRLLDKHGNPIPIIYPLYGGSAGGATARGWWSLFNNISIGEDVIVLINIDSKGKLIGVSQISNKVKVIVEDRKFFTIVVADKDNLNEAQAILNNYSNITVKLVETLDQLVKIDSISAIIDSYYPNSLNILQIGQSIKLSMTILNTGPIPWKFIGGVSLWNSEGIVMVSFEKELDIPLKVGHQTTIEWTYIVNQKGHYWLQFALWKEKPFNKKDQLDKQPSPKFRMFISSVPFGINNPENQESYLKNIDNVCDLSPISRSYLQETLKTYASYNFGASGIMLGITVELLVLEMWEAIVKCKDPTNQNPCNGKIEAIIDAIDKELQDPQFGIPQEMISMLGGYWPKINEQINRIHNKEGYPIELDSITPDSVHATLLFFPELAELIHNIIKWAKPS